MAYYGQITKGAVISVWLIGVSVLSNGCSRAADSDDRYNACIEQLQHSERLGVNGHAVVDGVFRDILSNTNIVERDQELLRFAKKIIDSPLNSDGYRQWDQSLAAVCDIVRGISCAMKQSEEGLISGYELELRFIEWHWQQLALLRPTRRIDPHDGLQHDDNWIAWYTCYERTFASLRMTVNMMEKNFWNDTKNMSQDKRERLKMEIEKTLRRSMRTKVEVQETRNWETEEYKTVKTRTVAP